MNTHKYNINRFTSALFHKLLKSNRPSHQPTVQLEQLEGRLLMSATPVISEFMASNSNTIADEDGSFSDWIEIKNPDATIANLEGWFLTDNPLNLTKWQFPAVTIDPGNHLLVFASDKDRTLPEGQLHTNFKLSANGEYLALVQPDGTTIASEFTPEYPPQFEDVSYGIAQQIQTTNLIADGDSATVLVPSIANGGDVLANAWTGGAEPFDDSSWTAGNTGIGFGSVTLPQPTLHWNFDEGSGNIINDSSGNNYSGTRTNGTWINSDLANVPGGTTAALDFDAVNAQINVTADTYQGILGNGARTVSTWIRTTAQPVQGSTAPTLVHWGGAGNGGRNTFRINENPNNGVVGALRLEVAGGYAVATTDITDGLWHHVAFTFDPADGGNVNSAKFYVDGVLENLTGNASRAINTIADANITIGDGPFDGLNRNFDGSIDEVRIYDRAITPEEVEALASAGALSNENINTDIGAQMLNNNASAFIRQSFNLTDASTVDQLELRVNYDDGFVAYINGQQVAARNAPVTPLWNDSATAAHDASGFESIIIPVTPSLLQNGTNILAIQGMNLNASDQDFVIVTELDAINLSGTVQTGYMISPTPGATNSSIQSNPGPLIQNVSEPLSSPLDTQDIIVTAEISPLIDVITSVDLTYRVMYGTETTLTMVDDGTAGDEFAGDGIYTAVIPHTASNPGEMVRWYVSAEDASGNTSRAPIWDPALIDQNNAPEYFGTVIQDDDVTGNLSVLQYFLAPGTESAQNTRAGTRAGVYYNGEFYDNVFTRVRGNSSAGLPKKSYKFDFNPGNKFRWNPDEPRVEEININTTYTDKAYLRQQLAFEVYDMIGLPASESILMQVQRNGEFFSVAAFVEQVDDDFLQREDLNEDGALYKMFNKFTSGTSGVEKKNRRDEGNADLVDFVNNINNLSGTALRNYVYDNVDIPMMLNYLAGTVLTQNGDQSAKNYYVYRDSGDTNEWFVIPWDLDLTFGLHFMTNDSILDDEIWADEDAVLGGAANNVLISPSHPFVGEQEHPQNRNYNNLTDKLLEIPEFVEMYLRRLRTTMDQILQAPGTATEELILETRIDELVAMASPDITQDLDEWANPWPWGQNLTLEQAIQNIKDEYLAVRRTHLYNTHSIDNLNPPPVASEILLVDGTPGITNATYFVPSDDSLNTTWTTPTFDDSAWTPATTGIGYETTGTNYQSLLTTIVNPNAISAGTTSTFVRIQFNIDDVNDIENLYLRMKYDDGFVAFINGVEVERTHVSQPDGVLVPYNAIPAMDHPDAQAIVYEDFDISSVIGNLVNGTNILAIQGVNTNPSSSDMLILPELVANYDNGPSGTDIAGIPHQQDDLAILPNIQFGLDMVFDPISGLQDEEYITIINGNDTAIDISDWKLDGGIDMTFKKGVVIPANTTLYVAKDVTAFRARTTGPTGGQGLLIQGGYKNNLSFGETVTLEQPDGTIVDILSTPTTTMQDSLRITELMYNPAAPSQAEIDAGFFDNDNFEFIELKNISEQSLNLAGVTFSNGIDFTFTAATTIDPGQYILLVSNQAAFEFRYGTQAPDNTPYHIAGQYLGQLDNSGEPIQLDGPQSEKINDFEFEDGDDPINEADWTTLPDGNNPSLDIIDPLASPESWDLGTSWRASGVDGGTPGRPDPVDGALAGDFNYDGIVNIADLAKLASNFNKNANTDPLLDIRWQHGDTNNDKIINIADLAKLASNFNKTQLFGGVAAALNILTDSTTNNQALLLNPQNQANNTTELNWNHIQNLLDEDSDTQLI